VQLTINNYQLSMTHDQSAMT